MNNFYKSWIFYRKSKGRHSQWVYWVIIAKMFQIILYIPNICETYQLIMANYN